jgi:hypothetical protein
MGVPGKVDVKLDYHSMNQRHAGPSGGYPNLKIAASELVEQVQSHGATKVGWQRGRARLEEEWDRGELAHGMGEHE